MDMKAIGSQMRQSAAKVTRQSRRMARGEQRRGGLPSTKSCLAGKLSRRSLGCRWRSYARDRHVRIMAGAARPGTDGESDEGGERGRERERRRGRPRDEDEERWSDNSAF